MSLNFFLLIASILLIFWFFRNIKKEGILFIAKGSLQLGILILVFGGFIKIFITLPSNILIKTIFCIAYLWCTIGVNVNFMIPLINLIDQKIDKYK